MPARFIPKPAAPVSHLRQFCTDGAPGTLVLPFTEAEAMAAEGSSLIKRRWQRVLSCLPREDKTELSELPWVWVPS